MKTGRRKGQGGSCAKNFKKNINYLIAKSGKTQIEIANETGITGSTITHYIKGERSPSLDNAYTLAKYFNTTIDSLCGISGDEIEIDEEALLKLRKEADFGRRIKKKIEELLETM